MREIAVCTDINLNETDLAKVEPIRQRALQRTLKRNAGLRVREQTPGIYSYLIGGERPFLTRLAAQYIQGNNIGVDELFIRGINVAALIDQEEYARLLNDPETYSLSAAYNIRTFEILISTFRDRRQDH